MWGIFLKVQNHCFGTVEKTDGFILKIQLRRQKKKYSDQTGEMEISNQ